MVVGIGRCHYNAKCNRPHRLTWVAFDQRGHWTLNNKGGRPFLKIHIKLATLWTLRSEPGHKNTKCGRTLTFTLVRGQGWRSVGRRCGRCLLQLHFYTEAFARHFHNLFRFIPSECSNIVVEGCLLGKSGWLPFSYVCVDNNIGIHTE